MVKSETTTYQTSIFNALKWPLILYSILAGLYFGYVLPGGKWSWFSYHPLFMLIGFVACAGNAVLLKKVGGYENTKNHGLLMGLALVCALFGWYVIYSNKEMFGKPHLKTLHGKLGAIVLFGYTTVACGGWFALNPDSGVLRTNQTFRFIHKWTGRFLTSAAWTCSVLGVMTMQKDISIQILLGLPLLIAGFFVLL
jgi:cytochrome b-561